MNPPDDDRTRVTPPPAEDRTLRVEPPFPPTERVPPPPAPAPPPDDAGHGLAIGTRLGEFEITRLLGEGGFGIVYLATDHSLQRQVALKEYMPSSLATRLGPAQVQVKSERHRETFDAGLKSFVNEARMLAQFDHPALVKVHRFWEGNGTAYMVMPYYVGLTLRDTLRRRNKQPPDEAWLRTLLAPLCEALEVIHAEHCYHRDIAPDNVMLLGGSHARPLLLDFGAARRVIGDMTQALTAILKPGYAPVEQYAEVPGMKQGPWTDVYALAAVIYACIMGRTPPPSVGRMLHDTYQPLAEAAAGRYSQPFLAAVDRALIVRPELRTPSIAALRADMGLGPSPAGAYSTQPLPLDMDAFGAAPSRPDSTRAVDPPADTMTQRAPRQPAPPPAETTAPPSRGVPVWAWAGAGALGLAVLGFGAYRWLASAPRPADPVVSSPAVAPLPAPTPTIATPVAAPAPWTVPRGFEDVVRAQSPDFRVSVTATPPTLRIGRDLLAFTVASEREGFLYVLAHGADGTLTQLYPNTESGALRVRPGEVLALPKRPVVFEVTEPAGEGHLLVMVSPRQRDLSALQPHTEGAFRSFPSGDDAARLAASHTGSTPWLAGRPVCPNGQDCADVYGAAMVTVEVVPGR